MPKYTWAIKQRMTRYYVVVAEDQEAAMAAIRRGEVAIHEEYREAPDYRNALVKTEEE